jgi:hypothetical protein
MPKDNAKAVYFSINNDAKYLFMAEKSIVSLRRYNKMITVYLFVYGNPPLTFLRSMKRLGVSVQVKKPVLKKNLYYLKWYPLPTLHEPRLLFVDADTLFFDNVEKLFRRYQTKDFYARRECGLEPGPSIYMIGSRSVTTRLDKNKFAKMARALGSKQLPVFNSGVMLFNHSSYKKIYGDGRDFSEIKRQIETRKVPYPHPNRSIEEEFAACMAMGRVKGLTYDLMDHNVSPYFVEWNSAVCKSRGIVMHVWSGFYPHALLEFEGMKELRKFTPQAHLYTRYRPNGMLPSGRNRKASG